MCAPSQDAMDHGLPSKDPFMRFSHFCKAVLPLVSVAALGACTGETASPDELPAVHPIRSALAAMQADDNEGETVRRGFVSGAVASRSSTAAGPSKTGVRREAASTPGDHVARGDFGRKRKRSTGYTAFYDDPTASGNILVVTVGQGTSVTTGVGGVADDAPGAATSTSRPASAPRTRRATTPSSTGSRRTRRRARRR